MFPLLQKISSRQIFPTKNAKSELSRCIRYSSYSTPCMLENLPIYLMQRQRSSQFPIVSEKNNPLIHDFPALISTIHSCHSSKPSRRKAKISDGSKQRHLHPGHSGSKMEDSQLQKKMSTKKGELPPPGDISGEILFKSHMFNLNLPSLQLSATCLTFGTNDRASNPSEFC